MFLQKNVPYCSVHDCYDHAGVRVLIQWFMKSNVIESDLCRYHEKAKRPGMEAWRYEVLLCYLSPAQVRTMAAQMTDSVQA